MLFNSLDFAVFLPIVFILYWSLNSKGLKVQNLLLVIASYVFYGWWDWRFLSLIFFSTLVDYTVGIKLLHEKKPSARKVFLWISILVNLGFLGVFKYYNFFVDNFVEAFSFFGAQINGSTLNVILPVGISFYTFQTLSYTIDVYKGKLEPTKNFIAFTAFVCFFPQLVAGPIERATNLLPQFYKQRKFEYTKAVDGLRQMLWGLFKKVLIADNCADFANIIFNNSAEYSGSTLFIGAIFFAFQIYCDFSGYSDIAIGTSRLFGFDLKRNFAFPYFSRDIAEFWRRWHISLSTWFRDYVYFPLGGSRGGDWMKVRNTFAIFLISGFWHGANWTFIAWGALNALYFLPLLLLKKNRKNLDVVAAGKYLPSLTEFFNILLTFCLTTLAWVFFRAENIAHAFSYLGRICSHSLLTVPEFLPYKLFALIAFLIVIEWLQRDREHGLDWDGLKIPAILKWLFIFVLTDLVLANLLSNKSQQFIYFDF